MGYVLLNDTLRVIKNDFILTRGQVLLNNDIRTKIKTPIKTSLKVNNVESLYNTHKFVAITNSHYEQIRNKLSQQRKLESKLELTDTPHWSVLLNEDEGHVIVSNNQADLMWEWDLDFVYDLDSENLLKIYSHQWFKGE